MSGFKKAQRKAKKIKMSIQGPSGAGKTFSALKIAAALVARTDPDKQVAFIDTEKSADMYAPPFEFEIDNDFGEGPKLSYHPDRLIEKLEAARKAGCFGAVIVDSLTHFWDGPGGFLTMHADIGAKQQAKGQREDTWGNWKYIDPAYDALWTYIRNYPLHLILCLRSEEKTEKNAAGKIEKVGLQAIFRKKWEFEVDIQFAVVDGGSVMMPWKHRLGSFLKDKMFKNPGDNVAEAIVEWMDQGAPEIAPAEVASKPAPVVATMSKPPAQTLQPAIEGDPTEAGQEAADRGVRAVEPTVASALEAKMIGAQSDAELALLAKEATQAKKDGHISADENKALSVAYKTAAARLKDAA